MLPPGLGKPPPLLPTPSGPRGRETPPGMREHSATPLMTSPGPYPIPQDQAPSTAVHAPGSRAPSWSLAPPFLHTASTVHYIEDHHGPRGAPPSLKSLHMGPQPGLFTCPAGN